MRNDFYLQFENKFRGKRDSILEQLSMYDSLVNLLLESTPQAQFIDIGCGRGEWLEKWKDSVSSCFGIESNSNMVQICLDNKLDVINGDALNTLKKIESASTHLVTMFHIIEHLPYEYLCELISECYRVLDHNGLLLVETPSIDNLLVSSRLFYLDPTHINPINPDTFLFYLDQAGFAKSKYYYIHGGPLENDNHLKVTRILNGVGQDVMFVAAKSIPFSKNIFESTSQWESKLDIGLSLLQTAIDYDLMQEKVLHMQEQINQKTKNNTLLANSLNTQFNDLKLELRHVFFFAKVLRFLLKPFIFLFHKFRKASLFLCSNIFDFLLIFKVFRKVLTNRFIIQISNLILKYIFNSSFVLNKSHIVSRINKYSNNKKFKKFNQYLLHHHKYSLRSNQYINILKNKKR